MRPELLQVLCFDIGGTLVRMRRGTLAEEISSIISADRSVVTDILIAHGKTRPTSPEALAAAIARTCDRADRTDEITAVLVQRRADASAPVLYEDAEPVLRSLRERGWRLFYLSNAVGFTDPGPEPGFFSHAEAVLHSWQIGRCTPDPVAYDAITALAGVPPEAIVHIGDSWDTDVAGALRVGWQAIHLLRDSGAVVRGLPEDPRVPRVSSLFELLDLLPSCPVPRAAVSLEMP